MDAQTLYVIVQLANGDLYTAHHIPWPTNRSCTEAAQQLRGGGIENRYLRSGAKSVMFKCGPTPRPLVIAE